MCTGQVARIRKPLLVLSRRDFGEFIITATEPRLSWPYPLQDPAQNETTEPLFENYLAFQDGNDHVGAHWGHMATKPAWFSQFISQ